MKSKGFTILEVMTAIFILTVGVGAALSLMNQTLATGSVIEQRLIASYLAQEGIEIVRNIRDSTWLEKRANTGIDWDEYLQKNVNGWEADYTSLTLTPYSGSGTPLNIQTDGFYGYGAADAETTFKRKITIAEIDPSSPDPDQRKVIVDVTWEERGRTHFFTTLEYITNWHEQ